MIKKILGWDLSSSTCGYAVLTINDKTKEIEFVSVNYIKPIKDGTIIERLADTRDKIKKIIEDIKPTEIAIEDILLFVQNRSTAQTIVTLASFNRMVGLLSFDYLGHMPSMYSVIGIRHALKPDKDFPAKEDMPELVAWHLNMNFPYEFSKKGKMRVECGDQADALSVALMHAFELGGKTFPKGTPPKMTPKIKKDKKDKKIKTLKIKKKK